MANVRVRGRPALLYCGSVFPVAGFGPVGPAPDLAGPQGACGSNLRPLREATEAAGGVALLEGVRRCVGSAWGGAVPAVSGVQNAGGLSGAMVPRLPD